MTSTLMFALILMQMSNKALAQLEPQMFEPVLHVNTELEEAFVGSRVVPDVIPKSPPKLLTARFDTANISLGNDIFPSRALLFPCVDFEAKSKTLYTFMMLDIDSPSSNSPVTRSYIIALHVNIPHTSVMRGFSAVPYVPPTPEPGSGRHRYVLLVYEQCDEINVKDEELISLGVFRWRFKVAEFLKKHCFTELIAGNFYTSEIPNNYADFC